MCIISIITVCYNAETSIERTINSVINQTFKNYEYIIIDGNSKDKTVEIINQYRKHINIIKSEPDKGIYDAMNKGIRLASGEWLIMMNAGDYFAENHVLETVFSNFIPNNIKFLYSNIYGLRPNGNKILRQLDYQKGNLIHQAVIYRRSLHEQHGYYIVTPKLIVSDYLFFIRIPEAEIMKLENVIISVYEGGGISSQGNWALQQALCSDVTFRRRSFWQMIAFYIWKRIKGLIPTEFKDKIKTIIRLK